MPTLTYFSICNGLLLFPIQSLKQQLVDKQPTTSTSTTLPSPTTTNDLTVTWQTYSIKELGITFKYPPNLQPMDYPNGLETNGQSGKQLCLSFIPFKTSFNLVKQVHAGGGPCQGILAVGSTSTDYEAGRGGGFGDMQGYTKVKDEYLANFVLDQQFPLPNSLIQKITNNNNVDFIIITGKSGDPNAEGGSDIPGMPPEGMLGALVNINKPPYRGFNIQMQLSKDLTKETFTQILSTLKFTN